jgi:hypothetical protein
MEIDLALLADAATVDASGKLNILGIFDRISTSGFPAQHPHIALVLRFTASVKESGTHSVVIRLSDPEGKEVLSLNGEIMVPPGSAGAGGRMAVPQIINMDRIVFPRPGRYAFDISLDGEHGVSVPLFLHDARPMGPVAQA